uniref:Uncharacterized protein n=1 Tax=Oryza glumipatula TaxID=40148 RepID=A0A0E0AHR9_9ORYZ
MINASERANVYERNTRRNAKIYPYRGGKTRDCVFGAEQSGLKLHYQTLSFPMYHSCCRRIPRPFACRVVPAPVARDKTLAQFLSDSSDVFCRHNPLEKVVEAFGKLWVGNAM